jgi:hypothetical protein
MRRLTLYYLFTSVFFILSCNDHLKIEENNDPQRYADSQFVGSWKIVSISSNVPWDWDNNGTTETNIFATLSNCEKDNLYTFVGDKTGTFKLNCSTTKNGSWEIINQLYLNYTPSGMPLEQAKVILMTSVQFQTTIAVTLSNGQPAIITKTWTRQ